MEDWEMLSNQDASAEDISQSVTSIVHTVKERLRMDSPSFMGSAKSYFSETLSQESHSSGGTSPTKSPRLILKSPRKRKSDLSKENTIILK